MTVSLSRAEARRIALAATGLAGPGRRGTSRASLSRVIADLGVLQIDSVNVFERSHYLPVLARAGAYDRSKLDDLTFSRGSGIMEYWGHEATFMPVEAWPLFRWRMDEARAKDTSPGSWASEHAELLTSVREMVRDVGPSTSRDLDGARARPTAGWWDWSDTKVALEVLFRWGELVSAGRRQFQRVYSLPEWELPAEHLATAPTREDAITELVQRAVVRVGVGTTGDIADYFRLAVSDTSRALHRLQDSGSVTQVQVPSWSLPSSGTPVWMSTSATLPARTSRDALLTPFDPVVWTRSRAERMWNFRYRIEIYTPAHKRVHGYYVLPVLLGGSLAARLDLKHDRKNSTILVLSSWLEPGAPSTAAARVARLLRATADWQGTEHIQVLDGGNFATELRGALQSSSSA